MEYRTLELNIISARGLKASLIGKMDVYAVASIYGTSGKDQKLRTHVHKDGGPNPTWNFPMNFTIDESAALQKRLTLVVKIKSVGMFGDKALGEVHVSMKELQEGASIEGKGMQFVSYQLKRPSGKPKGELSFSYKFGEKGLMKGSKGDEPVMAYPAGMNVGSSSVYPPPYAAGYAYQQQPAYGSYPPQPPPGYGYPAVQQAPKKSRFGMGTGLLGGALGGLLIGNIMSDAALGGGCGGGGCGGGGCGGF